MKLKLFRRVDISYNVAVPQAWLLLLEAPCYWRGEGLRLFLSPALILQSTKGYLDFLFYPVAGQVLNDPALQAGKSGTGFFHSPAYRPPRDAQLTSEGSLGGRELFDGGPGLVSQVFESKPLIVPHHGCSG